MLAVIFNWIYVIVTTYILGYAALTVISELPSMYTLKGKKKCVYEIRGAESYLIAGLIASTVYAQLFSLISGVSLAANIVLVSICAIIACNYRYELAENLAGIYIRFREDKTSWLYLVIFILFAYGTSHGLIHYDTDLYHAQSIRWIEEMGVVRGLGNIHLRLGYNSSSFALSALYSLSFLGKSMHTMAGYFALLLAWQCGALTNLVGRRHLILSDFVRLLAIYYLFTIFDEIVSPASDYFMTTMVIYILISWLDLYAMHERSFLPHSFLSLAAIYAATIKLSAAPLVLLSIYPIRRLIKKRKKEGIKPILFFLAMGLLIGLPFVIRNVILTGYLVYPVTGIDIFNVPWKVPRGRAILDAHEIIAYGRGFTDVAMYEAKMSEWVPGWLGGLGMFNKIMLLGDIIGFPVLLGCIVYKRYVRFVSDRVSEGKNKNKAKILQLSNRRSVSFSDFLFVECICYISLGYWFLSSPLIRYGCVYLWLPVAIMGGRFFILLYDHLGLVQNKAAYKVLCILIMAFLIYKSVFAVIDDIPRFRGEYLIGQQAYNSYKLESKDISGITFYYPKEGDRTGYDPFPSVPSPDGFRLLGSSVADGFASDMP